MDEGNSRAILLGLIFDSDIARAEHLTAGINARFGAGRARTGGDLSVEMAGADGLIKATPVGMAKLPGMPLPASLLRPELWAADIVYFPARDRAAAYGSSAWMSHALRRRHGRLPGRERFQLFTGTELEAERVLQHLAPMQTITSEGTTR